jgi:O-succinylbenzoate synthase
MADNTFVVDSIELRVVVLPLVHPFRTSFGVETERWTVVVSASSGDATGFGESPVARLPRYSYETTETAFHMLRDLLAPRVVGQPLGDPSDLPALYGALKGHPMARAGLEAALWDLRARLDDRSLAHVYGGGQEEIEVGVSIGIQDSLEDLVRRIGDFVDAGYGRVKIKIEHGWDVNAASAVRKAFPDLRLWADANQAYVRDDLERLRALDGTGLELLEQPLHRDDLAGHAAWARALDTPLCLDESVGNEVQLENAIEAGALAILNIKPPRVGGVQTAIRLEERCLKGEISVWCGGLLETGIGRLHNIAVASRQGFGLPGDLSASDRYFEKDLVTPPVRLTERGTLEIPSGPGLGHEVDLDFLEAVTVRKAVVRV